MSRSMDALTAAAFRATELLPILFVSIGTADEETDLRLWSGLGPFSWDGQIWTGLGDLVGFSGVEETREVAAQATSYQLAGVPAATIPASVAQMKQGRPVRMWLGAVNRRMQLVGEPVQLERKLVDRLSAEDDGKSATFTLTAEGWLADFRKSRVSRYTSEDQKRRYPSDRGFEYVAYLQDAQILWGRT